MINFYAGIGSRDTPPDVLDQMRGVSKRLHDIGWFLRSGGARNADAAFEANAGQRKEIFLPWVGFNDNPSLQFTVDKAGLELAQRFHPGWNNCGWAAMKLHARNGYIVLGRQLDYPVEFVVCWTPGGKIRGGTGQALRIAKEYRIKVFNLGRNGDDQELKTRLDREEKRAEDV